MGKTWSTKPLLTRHPQSESRERMPLFISLSLLQSVQDASSWDEAIHIYDGSSHLNASNINTHWSAVQVRLDPFKLAVNMTLHNETESLGNISSVRNAVADRSSFEDSGSKGGSSVESVVQGNSQVNSTKYIS